MAVWPAAATSRPDEGIATSSRRTSRSPRGESVANGADDGRAISRPSYLAESSGVAAGHAWGTRGRTDTDHWSESNENLRQPSGYWCESGGDPSSWEKEGIWGEDEGPGDPWYIDSHDLVLHPSAESEHRFTLVLLHSCSGGPDDFLPFIHRFNLPFRGDIRIVVPCAPVRAEEHSSWQGKMNSWFEYSGNGVKDRRQLTEQRHRILRLLEDERGRLPGGDARRLVLGGLSQGVSLAIDVALHAPFSVGGVFALRGMALRESLEGIPERPEGSQPLEVLAFHGRYDNQCPVEEAKASYEALALRGVARLRFEAEHSLGHACARGRQRLCRRELHCVNAFLRRIWDAM